MVHGASQVAVPDGKLMPRQREEVATGNLFFFRAATQGARELWRDRR